MFACVLCCLEISGPAHLLTASPQPNDFNQPSDCHSTTTSLRSPPLELLVCHMAPAVYFPRLLCPQHLRCLTVLSMHDYLITVHLSSRQVHEVVRPVRFTHCYSSGPQQAWDTVDLTIGFLTPTLIFSVTETINMNTIEICLWDFCGRGTGSSPGGSLPMWRSLWHLKFGHSQCLTAKPLQERPDSTLLQACSNHIWKKTYLPPAHLDKQSH